MEIVEFLRLRPRRIIALLLVALVFAVPTTGALLLQPRSYTATASVPVSSLSLTQATTDQSPSALDNSTLDQYEAALTVSEVAQATASRTGVPVAQIVNGIHFARPSNARSGAQVSFTNHDPAKAQAVARQTALGALSYLARQRVDQVGNFVRAASAEVSTAITGLQSAPTTAQYTTDQTLINQALSTDQSASSALVTAQVNLASLGSGDHLVVTVTEQGRTKVAAVGGFVAGASVLLLALLLLAVRAVRLGTVTDDGTSAEIGAASSLGLARRPRRRVQRRRVRHPARAILVGGALALVPASLAVAELILLLSQSGRTALAVAIGVPVGAAAVILAVFRFEIFLLFLLVIRAGIDSIAGSGGLDPATAVGGVFIVAAALWLVAQRQLGRWRPTSTVTKWLWVFAAACALSVPTSVRPAWSAQATFKVIAGVLMFNVLEQYLGQDPRRVRKVIACVLVSCISPMLIGLEQAALGHGNTNYVDVSRVMGNFSHPSTYATYLLMVMPLALLLIRESAGMKRVALGAIVGVSTLLIMLTYTRAAWAAVLAIVIYLGLRVWRRLLWILAALLVVILIAVPSVAARVGSLGAKPVAPGVPSSSLSWRFSYWGQVAPLADHDPITGIGFDGVQKVTSVGLQPHNGFVEAYVETGVFGLVAIIGVICALCQYLRRRMREARPGLEQTLALAAVAAAIGVALQFPVENMLTQTFVFWYFGAVLTFGLPSGGTDREPDDTDGETAFATPRSGSTTTSAVLSPSGLVSVGPDTRAR